MGTGSSMTRHVHPIPPEDFDDAPVEDVKETDRIGPFRIVRDADGNLHSVRQEEPFKPRGQPGKKRAPRAKP